MWKKCFLLLIPFVLLIGSTSAVHAGEYAAIAVGPGGYASSSGYWSMDAARDAAVARCRDRGYGSCSTSVAEMSHWYYGAGYCFGSNGDKVPYAAATGWARSQAKQRLREIIKAKGAADGYHNCRLALPYYHRARSIY